MTARPITIAQPPAKPWTNRAAIMIMIVGAIAQPTEAAVMTTVASSSSRRRPCWSEIGPPMSWPRPIPMKKVVKVSWTWVAPADRSAATRGKAGTYMSVASGAIAVRKITLPTNADVNRGRAVGRTGSETIVVTAGAEP